MAGEECEVKPLNSPDTRSRSNAKYVTLHKVKAIAVVIFLLLICLVAGILIGMKATSGRPMEERFPVFDVRSVLFADMKAENIRKNHEKLASKPHIAGTPQEEVLADWITDRWRKELDEVKIYKYNVMLSYPNASNPNYVAVKRPDGTIYDKSDIYEPVATPDEHEEDVPPSFNGWGNSGHAEGPMVYVNYARKRDFDFLKSNVSIDVTGKICIARYGRGYRGTKAKFAERNGCSGLVLFSDPGDYGNHDNISIAYPNNWWLPTNSLQRGTLLRISGDPLTPYYPSTDYSYRIPNNETILPKIPVTPISSLNALKFLEKFGGTAAPGDWQGGLNITYRFGDVMKSGYENHSFVIHSGNYRPRANITNVVGFIWGSEEPDRLVIMGNHRDAWVYGGMDPSSGTAVMLEVARSMGELVKSGKWRPRRTIMFISWDAEEYGLIGSNEWVEEFEKSLLFKAVIYLNIDISVQGNATFRAKATPNLRRILREATSAVENPDPSEVEMGRPTVYDTWKAKYYDKDNTSRPYLKLFGAGSDFKMLVQKTGIPGADIRYTWDEYQTPLSSYPVYHSVHDTVEYYQKFLDPEYKVNLAVAKISGEILRRVAEDKIIPLSLLDYALEIKRLIKKIEEKSADDLENHDISLDHLNAAVESLVKGATIFMDTVNNADLTNVLEMRELNDRIMQFDRALLDFMGLPGRPYYRNIVYAPSTTDAYLGVGFSALKDSIINAKVDGEWENVKKQLAITTFHLHSAASVLVRF